MFDHIGWPEILLIVLIVMMVFGVGKLPEVGKSIGKAIHGFREAQKGEEEKAAAPAKEPEQVVSAAENKQSENK